MATNLPGLDLSRRARLIRTLKSVAVWLVIVGVAVGGYYGFVWYRKKHAVVEPRFRTVKVDKANVAAKVTATGTLSARITVQVGSQVSGRLSDIFVDFNSPVKKGQVIAKLDPRIFQAELLRARANWSQGKGQLDKAKLNQAQAEKTLERSKRMKTEGLLGEADLETAQLGVDSAKADVVVAKGNVDQAAAALTEAQVNLGFTTIISPIDGIVLSRSVDVGQTVAASLSAPVLFTIAQDLKVIQLDTYVAEADVGKLRTGMEATFSVDAYPGQKFKGVIRDVRNASTTVQNVVTYDAVLDVHNDDGRLRPGMTANVTFVYSEAKDALVVPNAALRFRPPAEALDGATPAGSGSGGRHAPGSGSGRRNGNNGGGDAPGGPGTGSGSGKRAAAEEDPTKKRIYVVRDDHATSVRVTTGVSDGSNTEIVSGDVHQGDEVAVEYTAPSDAPTTKATSTPIPGAAPGAGRGGRLF